MYTLDTAALAFVQGAQLHLCCLVAGENSVAVQPETTVVGHTALTWLYTSFYVLCPPPPPPSLLLPTYGMWFDMIGRGGGP